MPSTTWDSSLTEEQWCGQLTASGQAAIVDPVSTSLSRLLPTLHTLGRSASPSFAMCTSSKTCVQRSVMAAGRRRMHAATYMLYHLCSPFKFQPLAPY